MRLAPIGAFGAMAFTVGRYGIGSLLSLGQLMAGVYITCLLFVIIVLGTILPAGRARPVEVPPLHPRGDSRRAGHVVVGVRAYRA
jgi:Na+/H+-dicarboxylate symporter